MCVQLQKGNFCLWAYKAFPNRQKPSKCHFIVENIRSKWVGATDSPSLYHLCLTFKLSKVSYSTEAPKFQNFALLFSFKITISLGSTLAIHLHSSLHDSATLSHVSGLTVPPSCHGYHSDNQVPSLSYSYISFNLNPTHLQTFITVALQRSFLWKPIALGVSTHKT